MTEGIGGPLRILYVDDDHALARLAARVLARHQIEVVHAPSIAAGLEQYDAGTFDAIVLDHHFTEKTGLHFLEAISDRRGSAPVLYVTGSSDAQIAIRALKAGAADYVIKSVTDDFFPLLVSAIQQALENDRLRQAKQQADRLLVAAKERAELMVAEMNHRISNSLALVAAMARLQIQAVRGEEAKSALAEMQNRIIAIAGVHRSLYTSDDIGEVELQTYLGALVGELAGSSGSAGLKITAEIDAVAETADKAVNLGVITTELVTNAIKYAYPTGEGLIRVSLTQRDGKRVLRVADDGVGYDATKPPSGTGLGSKLLQAMASSLHGTIAVHASTAAGTGTDVSVTWSPVGRL